MIKDTITVRCRCGSTFKRTPRLGRRQLHCSAQCREAASLDMRRERRTIERDQQHRITGTVAWCHDCQMGLTPAAAAASHDGHNWKITFTPCFECGRNVSVKNHYKPGDYVPDGLFHSEECWLRWWRRRLAYHQDTTVLAQDMTAEDVAYHPGYVKSHGLASVLRHTEIEELFGTLNDPLTGYHLARFDDFGNGEEVIQTARTVPLGADTE